VPRLALREKKKNAANVARISFPSRWKEGEGQRENLSRGGGKGRGGSQHVLAPDGEASNLILPAKEERGVSFSRA